MTFYTKVCLIALMALLLPMGAFAQQSATANYSSFSSAFAAPGVTASVGAGTSASYTAGTIAKGGTTVAITAGTIAASFATTANNCDGPLFSSCEIVYWTSGTGLTHTTNITTANTGTNIPVAYCTTTAGVVQSCVPASLDLPKIPVVIDCGTSATCAAPTGRTLSVVIGSGTEAATGAVTLTGLPFSTGVTGCFVSITSGTGTTGQGFCQIVSATSVILQGPAGTGANTFEYTIFGYFVDPQFEYGSDTRHDLPHRLLQSYDAWIEDKFNARPW